MGHANGHLHDWYRHGGSESAVGGEPWESEFWQRDGEHCDDAVVDADVDGDISGDGELRCNHRHRLHDRGSEFPCDTEPESIVDASGAVRSDSGWDSQRAAHDQ